ncbi:hypothetical protein [Dongshaea marina]|nr:hypothetical protein [Dongshaea marina]
MLHVKEKMLFEQLRQLVMQGEVIKAYELAQRKGLNIDLDELVVMPHLNR